MAGCTVWCTFPTAPQIPATKQIAKCTGWEVSRENDWGQGTEGQTRKSSRIQEADGREVQEGGSQEDAGGLQASSRGFRCHGFRLRSALFLQSKEQEPVFLGTEALPESKCHRPDRPAGMNRGGRKTSFRARTLYEKSRPGESLRVKVWVSPRALWGWEEGQLLSGDHGAQTER